MTGPTCDCGNEWPVFTRTLGGFHQCDQISETTSKNGRSSDATCNKKRGYSVTQQTFDGQFSESEMKDRLKEQQREELEAALTTCGYRYKHTAWRLAIFVHIVATGDGILRRSPQKLAKDKGLNRKERSIQQARTKLADAGIINIVEEKNLDGGDNLKAMQINRSNVRKIAAGENLRPVMRPANQGANHPANQGARQYANQGANSNSLYRTMDQSTNNHQPLPPTSGLTSEMAEAAEILRTSKLSASECNRLVLEYGIGATTAKDTIATFDANRSKFRSAAAIAWRFDHGEWPAEDVREISAEESHLRTMRAAQKRLWEKVEDDPRYGRESKESQASAVDRVMSREFGEDWKAKLEGVPNGK